MSKSLTELFNDKLRGEHVSSPEFEAVRMAELDNNYAQKEGGAERIGRAPLYYSKPSDDSPNNPKKKEKAFAQLLYRLREQQQWIKLRLDQLREQIDHLTEEIDQHARNIEALDEFMEHYRETGEFDLAEDGYPADDTVRRLIEEYEQETGIVWDTSSPKALGIRRSIEEQQRIQKSSRRWDGQTQ